VVSKNGNFLVNIPLRGDGTMDSDGVKVLEEIGEWMSVNKESILATRPWRVFGEGPALEHAAPLSAQGFNEGKGKPFGAQDIRFTTKGKYLYAIVMEWPESGSVLIKSLASDNPALTKVNSVRLLGYGKLKNFTRGADGLKIMLPVDRKGLSYGYVLKIG
jgi:alpha-L-fucosidase